MSHPLPTEAISLRYDLRILDAGLRIKRGSDADSVPLHHLHKPPDADPGPIIAPRIIKYVGIEMRELAEQGDARPAIVEVLDIRDDHDRDPRTTGKPKRFARLDRRILETAVVHIFAPRLTVDGACRRPT